MVAHTPTDYERDASRTDMETVRSLVHDYAHRVREHFGDRVRDIWLYGSAARGDWTTDSDIDVLVLMKAKNTIRESRSDWHRLEAMVDSDVDVSDIPELDKSFFDRAHVRLPQRKRSISLRIDPDVLAWFKRQGRGYQTRINQVLKAYVHAHQH